MSSTTLGTACPKIGHEQRSRRLRLGALGLATIIATLGLSTVGGEAQAAVQEFQTNTGIVQPATGLPMPASGKQLALMSNGAVASTTVSGSGRVVVGAIASLCSGAPILDITVDGVAQSAVTITKTSSYGANMPRQSVPKGSHVVKIGFNNDEYQPGVCDRNVYLASVRMEFASTSTPTGPTKPNASNTGVPDGTPLTVHNGDIQVTQAGTVIDALDVRGAIYVKANNVTIKRSIIRGGAASSANKGLIVSWWKNTGLKIEDSTLSPDHPSFYLDGLSAGNFTATRLDISKGIDSVKIIGGNASLTNSWLHGNSHFSPDPNQSDNKSHDDGVQVTGGSNIVISNNTIEGVHNAAIMVGQGTVVADVDISGNWLGGGGCAINVTQNGTGGPINGMKISKNRFSPGSYGTTCPMRLPSASPITLSGNVWDSNGQPAKPVWF